MGNIIFLSLMSMGVRVNNRALPSPSSPTLVA
jgi:hypothetical protein